MHDDIRDAHMLWTNRHLLEIRRGRALRELAIACFPELEAQSYEAFSSRSSYYLIDRPRGDGDQIAKRDAILKAAFPRIFRCELAHVAIPLDQWPDSEDFESFRKYFTWDYVGLMADLGTDPVTTKSVVPDREA